MNPALDFDLVVHGGAVPTWLIDRLRLATAAEAVLARPPQAVRLRRARRVAEVKPLCATEKLDFAYIESGRRLSDYGLLAMDMDSTLITIECIDEVADFAGKKAEVSAITESAMRGEIDYTESLRRRVALLAGLPESTLGRVYEERLRLSAGARELLAASKAAGLKTMVVSGGFTYFTGRLKEELGLDYAYSNVLEVVDGKLTGRVTGDIVDARGKARHVAEVRQQLGLGKAQVITIGDGANDLLMMAESGLSVAFHAKPVAREEATMALNFAGLDGLLAVLDA
jgi:phosphoserine phosphatase